MGFGRFFVDEIINGERITTRKVRSKGSHEGNVLKNCYVINGKSLYSD